MHKILILVLTISLIQSCGSDDAKTNEDQTEIQEVHSEDIEVAAPIPFDHLPSPLQVAYLFHDGDLTFQKSALLPHDFSAADFVVDNLLYLGAYSADLAYASLHGRKQESGKCLRIVVDLADDLGFATEFNNPDYVKRFENNIGNPDSLGQFLSDLEYDISRYIKENNEEQRSLIIFTGAWVETMKIGVDILEYEPNEFLVYQLLDQKEIAETLLENLERIKKYDNSDTFLSLLSTIENINSSLSVFDLSDPNEIEIDRDDYDNLIRTIKESHKELLL